MGLFDSIQNQASSSLRQTTRSTTGEATGATGQAAVNIAGGGNKSLSVTFFSIPTTLAEFAALPQAALRTPADTAAMCIIALCAYKHNVNECIAMMNALKGPVPMNQRDISFLNDRMRQNSKAGFIGESYFVGATPQNEYTPSQPYTIIVSENPYSYDQQGYVKLFIKSGGADSGRPITMRQAKDGRWYLWEYSSMLLDIRAPESTNPWA